MQHALIRARSAGGTKGMVELLLLVLVLVLVLVLAHAHARVGSADEGVLVIQIHLYGDGLQHLHAARGRIFGRKARA